MAHSYYCRSRHFNFEDSRWLTLSPAGAIFSNFENSPWLILMTARAIFEFVRIRDGLPLLLQVENTPWLALIDAAALF